MFFVVSSNCVDKEEWKKLIIFPFYSFQPDWLDTKKNPKVINLLFAISLKSPNFQSLYCYFIPQLQMHKVTQSQSSRNPKLQLYPKLHKSKVTKSRSYKIPMIQIRKVTKIKSYVIPKLQKSKVTIIPKVT